MKFFKIIVLASLLIFNGLYIHAQEQFDIRKTKWGMTIEQVKQSELPLTPPPEAPSGILHGTKKETKNEITFENVVINDINTTITYRFQNGKLIEVAYRLNKNSPKKDMGLYDKVISTHFVFNNLINEKKMIFVDCWSYGLKAYGDFNVKYKNTHDYTSVELINDVQKIGTQNGFQDVDCRLKNERTSVRLKYRLIDDDPKYEAIIAWITFSPCGNAENDAKDSGF